MTNVVWAKLAIFMVHLLFETQDSGGGGEASERSATGAGEGLIASPKIGRSSLVVKPSFAEKPRVASVGHGVLST